MANKTYHDSNNRNWNNNNQSGNRNNTGSYNNYGGNQGGNRNNYGSPNKGKKNTISEVSSPFNFVPLPEIVVHPEWASRISHDVPFSDGISGTISLSLTAESPIFVRNGHTRTDAEKKTDTYNSFSRIGDTYLLPGTTVKGVVRSVLEILSFGKMHLDRNMRFAQREWYNTQLYTLKGKQGNVHCGWLKETDDGNYEIIDCGKPYRISHPNIEKYLSTLVGPHATTNIFTSKFSENSDFIIHKPKRIGYGSRKEYDPKTAEYKYRLIETICSLDKLHNLRFKKIEPDGLKVFCSNDGGIIGSIVLTGQPDKRRMEYDEDGNIVWKGKFFEFVFPDPEDKTRLPLSKDEFEQYKFIYADSPDWKYLNEKMLGKTGIPVFFRLDKSGKRIFDWGLAYLYKLPYRNTPYDTLPEPYKSDAMDMADCIFGFSSDTSSLRGRVQFTSFTCRDSEKIGTSKVTLTLGSPKASYYPIYIDQEIIEGNGKLMADESFLTYNDGYIRGWKRYLRRDHLWGDKGTNGENENNIDNKVDTRIDALNKGAVFEGKIHFHNLKPEELGAILSALTFHGDQKANHLIGMAKPYGYGKVKLEISGIDLHIVGKVAALTGDTQDIVKGYMEKFKIYMDQELSKVKYGQWLNNPTIKELLCMAEEEVDDSIRFRYMTLDVKNRKNDFNSAKGGKLYLQPFNEIIKKK